MIKEYEYEYEAQNKAQLKFIFKQNKLIIPIPNNIKKINNIQEIIYKGDKPPIIINMKNYNIENKKNGDKLLKIKQSFKKN
jgi:hypothetical protein